MQALALDLVARLPNGLGGWLILRHQPADPVQGLLALLRLDDDLLRLVHLGDESLVVSTLLFP